MKDDFGLLSFTKADDYFRVRPASNKQKVRDKGEENFIEI